MLRISLAFTLRIANSKIGKEDCRSKAIIRGEREICQGDRKRRPRRLIKKFLATLPLRHNRRVSALKIVNSFCNHSNSLYALCVMS